MIFITRQNSMNSRSSNLLLGDKPFSSSGAARTHGALRPTEHERVAKWLCSSSRCESQPFKSVNCSIVDMKHPRHDGPLCSSSDMPWVYFGTQLWLSWTPLHTADWASRKLDTRITLRIQCIFKIKQFKWAPIRVLEDISTTHKPMFIFILFICIAAERTGNGK